MTLPYRTVEFRDELLADGTVYRAYGDGRREWRRTEGPLVRWRDDRGTVGTDELLGRRIIKRDVAGRRPLYGRDCGYGRTAWSDSVLTVNLTSLGGRTGTAVAGLGAAGLLPAVVDPPASLTLDQEAELRAAQAQSGGDVSVTVGGDSGETDWSDAPGTASDDFG